MALFSNESDKNVRPEMAIKPQSSPAPEGSAVQLAPERGNPPAAASPSAETFAYLDQGAKVSGKLNFEGPARIDGMIDGEIVAKGILTIGESAVVKAQIKAVAVIVAGTVSGEIDASQRIEIRPSARMSGNITTPKLIVHEDAVFDGHCAMQSEGEGGNRKIAAIRKKEPNGTVLDPLIQAPEKSFGG
jgi:cytoskeletal protein CcmA (bactofilin family)